MNDWNNILDNIKAIRADKGLGQEYMAAQLGMTQAGYALWEKGKRELTYNNLLRISEALKCDIVDVIRYNKPINDNKDCSVKTNEKVSITFEVDPQQRDYLLHLVMGQKKE